MVLLLAMIFLVACSSKVSIVLDDISCNGQCWENINIDDNDENIIISKLKSITEIDQNSLEQKIITSIPYIDKIIFGNFINTKEENFELSIYDNRVNFLYFKFRNEINLEELINKFGEPNSIYIQATNIGEPSTYLTINILYENPNICFHLDKSLFWPFNNPKTYTIKAYLNIESVIFLTNTIENGQLIYGCLRGYDKYLDVYKKNVQEWKGYGDYIVYRDGFPFLN